MKTKQISLRRAITLPLLLVLIGTFIISAIRYTADYNFLAVNQGTKIVEAMKKNTQNELNSILSEPLIMTELIGETISKQKMHLNEDLSDIQDYQMNLMRILKEKMPQVSVISYGDENGNYVGVRNNGIDQENSLMLKDKRTNYKLNIYEGESFESRILSSFENYDPRIRPWYEPVRRNIANTWSDIYINQDEKMEATISISVPVLGEREEFVGVFEMDIKLNGINDFLKENKTNNTVVFLVNENLDIVAHSENENNVIIEDKSNFQGKLLNINDSETELIRYSEKNLLDKSYNIGTVYRENINNEKVFFMKSNLENPRDLNWDIVVIIPEDDLMGEVKQRYNITLAIISIAVLLSTILGIFLMKNITEPILKVADGYSEIMKGNLNIKINHSDFNIRETHELINGFNLMAENINDYIQKLIMKQEEIELIHKTETQRMNKIIDEKTKNLESAMKELLEREKMASLGELVSGVAHEINTPLGVAVSASSLMEVNNESFKKELMQGNISKSGLIDYIESIDETTSILNSNLYRASELVKSFKEVAVNQSIEEKSKFNLREYIDSILLSLKHEYKNKNIDFEIDFPADLVIDSYSGAISQIFTNLIMNSLVHGFRDRKSGKITISALKNNEKLMINYKDNGLGMSKDVQKHVFEPFYTTNRGEGGSGLGMNIVYNLVTAKLNGKISCISEIGIGTEFVIEIKL